MLVALRLPPAVVLPLAGFAVATFFVVLGALVWQSKKPKAHAMLHPAVLLVASVACSLFMLAGFTFFVSQPLQAYAGKQAKVTAQVLQVAPGYNDDTLQLEVKIVSVDGKAPLRPFVVRIANIADMPLEIGDLVSLDVRFTQVGRAAKTSLFAKGIYIAASPKSVPVVQGQKLDFLCRLRMMQNLASDNIRARLPFQYGGVAAAMAVGDTRHITSEAKSAYRTAGFSHLLTVSGLHFSIVSSIATAAVYTLVYKKRLAAVLCMVFVVMFALFTGLQPSVARCAVVYVLMFSAVLFRRTADIYTSLALAAVLLLTQNPYAAADVGVQLSFSATLGVMLGGYVAKTNNSRRVPIKTKQKFARLWWRLAKARQTLHDGLYVSIFATLSTLPILIMHGMGISIVSVPMNMLAMPLASPVVLGSLLLALPMGFAPLDSVLAAFGVLQALLMRVLELLTLLAGSLGGVWHVGMLAGMGMILALPIVLAGVKQNKLRVFSLAACLVVVAGLAMDAGFSYGTVAVTLAGKGDASALVITEGSRAVIIYRGVRGANAINDVLQKNGASDCVLLVDMRAEPKGEEYRERFSPQQVRQSSDIVYREVYKPFDNVQIYMQRQGDGLLACVDIGGYKIAMYTGKINVQEYPRLDVLVAGRGTATGNFDMVLVGDTLPEWLEEGSENIYYIQGQASFLVRPYKSMRYKEIQYAALE